MLYDARVSFEHGLQGVVCEPAVPGSLFCRADKVLRQAGIGSLQLQLMALGSLAVQQIHGSLVGDSSVPADAQDRLLAVRAALDALEVLPERPGADAFVCITRLLVTLSDAEPYSAGLLCT